MTKEAVKTELDIAAKLAKATGMDESVVYASGVAEEKMTAMFNKIASNLPYMYACFIGGLAAFVTGVAMMIEGSHHPQIALFLTGIVVMTAGAVSALIGSDGFRQKARRGKRASEGCR